MSQICSPEKRKKNERKKEMPDLPNQTAAETVREVL